MFPIFTRRALIAAAITTAALIVPAQAQQTQISKAGEYIQKTEKGDINWTILKMKVKGQAAPNPKHTNPAQARIAAERAAKMDALRNALEVVKGVAITSSSTVEDFMLTSDTVKAEVNGVIQGAIVVDTTYQSDTGVSVFIEVPIMGELAEILMPKELGSAVPPEVAPGSPAPAIDGQVYTGLIIDATGLGVRPAMSPQVLDESGAVLYSAATVSREYALQMGLVGYARDVATARANDRVGASPLVIKAKGKQGDKSADVVLSAADAARLNQIIQHQSFLTHCRVVIVL